MLQIATTFPNSLVLVLDPVTGTLPSSMGGHPIAASPSGVAVGTLSEFDGNTTVVPARPSDSAIDPNLVLRWQGQLQTSGRIGTLIVGEEPINPDTGVIFHRAWKP
ncbi:MULTISPECIES: hypothetical protein [Janibacter]|uniref:hypothetical protein n=1 Tax=Janibacter TaxID=53457 RepID=UPI000FE433EF|nr:hypothetical protein [Janibacter hoylei]MCT1618527.1 hypothetical protein [Janibacter hoylei]MCT2293164.1 hypothetical protein [Janibacter hoylei]